MNVRFHRFPSQSTYKVFSSSLCVNTLKNTSNFLELISFSTSINKNITTLLFNCYAKPSNPCLGRILYIWFSLCLLLIQSFAPAGLAGIFTKQSIRKKKFNLLWIQKNKNVCSPWESGASFVGTSFVTLSEGILSQNAYKKKHNAFFNVI